MRLGCVARIALVLLASLAQTTGDAQSKSAKKGRFVTQLPGYQTKIHVYVPGNYTGKKTMGLIIGLHGSGGDGGGFLRAWSSSLLSKYRFIMVAPDSLTRTWAMGGDAEGQKREGDYIKAIVERMRKDYRIDEEKIFVTGFSAGSSYLMVAIAALDQFRAFKIRGAALFSGGVTGQMGVRKDKAEETTIRIYVGAADTPHLGPAQNAVDSFKKAGYRCELLKVRGAHNYPLVDHSKVLQWFAELYEPVRRRREVEDEIRTAREYVEKKKYRYALRSYRAAEKKAEKEKERCPELVEKVKEGLKELEAVGEGLVTEAEKLAGEGKWREAYRLLSAVEREFSGLEAAKKAKAKREELKKREREGK